MKQARFLKEMFTEYYPLPIAFIYFAWMAVVAGTYSLTHISLDTSIDLIFWGFIAMLIILVSPGKPATHRRKQNAKD